MKELENEEMQDIEGGAAGYGNVQFTCECGKVCLTPTNFMKHVHSSKHKSGKLYHQEKSGKSSQGKYIGKVTVKFDKKGNPTIKYPNGKTESAIVSGGTVWDRVN